jgi:hypothetical protein
MNLKVKREKLTDRSTIGRMRILGDDNFSVYTLEPPKRPGDVKPRAIDAGTYPLTIRYSPKHGRLIPHIEDVPHFVAIEIHIGNKPEDTDGCTVVGRTNPAPDFIGASHAAFDDLFPRLMNAAAEYDGGDPDEHVVYHVGFITFEDPGVAA